MARLVMSRAIIESFRSWFEAVLPDGLDAIAEVVKDTATLDAATGGQETTDDAGFDYLG